MNTPLPQGRGDPYEQSVNLSFLDKRVHLFFMQYLSVYIMLKLNIVCGTTILQKDDG
jgi:hypothetical protein